MQQFLTAICMTSTFQHKYFNRNKLHTGVLHQPNLCNFFFLLNLVFTHVYAYLHTNMFLVKNVCMEMWEGRYKKLRLFFLVLTNSGEVLTFGYTTNPSQTFCKVPSKASAVRNASGTAMRLHQNNITRTT